MLFKLFGIQVHVQGFSVYFLIPHMMEGFIGWCLGEFHFDFNRP